MRFAETLLKFLSFPEIRKIFSKLERFNHWGFGWKVYCVLQKWLEVEKYRYDTIKSSI
jgi:hypothetical protein